MNCVIIIPARFNSKRIPGKPLINIKGKPMIIHVLERAIKSGIKHIIISTDNLQIKKVIENAGGEVFFNKLNHKCGTERLAEVVKHYNFQDDTTIINLQCDEPFIPSNSINQVAKNLIKNQMSSMTTLAVPILNYQEAQNTNIVKVVINSKNYALYFSRSLIPWNNNFNKSLKISDNKILRHIGIYAYKSSFIRQYINWEISPIERMEKLEQLRVLWYGKKIHVEIINNNIEHFSIDTLEDLKKIK